jgi:hypothetical protein
MTNAYGAFNSNIHGIRNLKFGHAAYVGSDNIFNLNNKEYIKYARELGILVQKHHPDWTLDRVLDEGCKPTKEQMYHPIIQKKIIKMIDAGYVMIESCLMITKELDII